MSGVPAAGVQPSQGVTTDGESGEQKTLKKRKAILFLLVFLTCSKTQVKKLTKFFGDEPPLLRLYLKVIKLFFIIDNFDMAPTNSIAQNRLSQCHSHRTLVTRSTRVSLRRRRSGCLSCPTFPRKDWRSWAFPWGPG